MHTKILINDNPQVAKMAGDVKGRQRVESQLLRKLKGVSLEAEEAKGEDAVAGEDTSPALGDLLDNLKIEKTRPKDKMQGKDGLQKGRQFGQDTEDRGGKAPAWGKKDTDNVR